MREIKWYDAKEVHPARNGWVVVITDRNNQIGTVIDVQYEDGYFNGKESKFDNVACWAYESDFEDVFNNFKEEDDF